MSSSKFAPDAKIVWHARKDYQCYACGCKIPTGHTYLSYMAFDDADKLKALHLCVECGFLVSCMDGNHRMIKKGGFAETTIPNCLRKQRAKFRANPRQAMHEQGLDEPVKKPSADKQCAYTLVVSPAINTAKRRFFAIPARLKRYSGIKHGDLLRVQQGIGGEVRVKAVQAAKQICKESAAMLNKQERCICVMTD